MGSPREPIPHKQKTTAAAALTGNSGGRFDLSPSALPFTLPLPPGPWPLLFWAVRGWLGRVGVRTLSIEPASPWENGLRVSTRS